MGITETPAPEKLLQEHSDQFLFTSTKYEDIGLPRSKEKLFIIFRKRKWLEIGTKVGKAQTLPSDGLQDWLDKRVRDDQVIVSHRGMNCYMGSHTIWSTDNLKYNFSLITLPCLYQTSIRSYPGVTADHRPVLYFALLPHTSPASCSCYCSLSLVFLP